MASCVALTVVAFSGPATAQKSRWILTSANSQPVEGEAWLSFDKDGTFSGNNGCNAYQGAGRFEGNGFFVDGPVATTQMACRGEALTIQQDTVTRVPGGGYVVTRYDPSTHTLALTQRGDRLELKRQNGGDTEGDGPRQLLGPTIFDVDYLNVFGLSGPLNIRETPSTGAVKVARVLPGTLLRSSGCEQRADRIWCAVNSIDASGKQGWAAGDYLRPAPALLRASSEVFDNIGTLVCADDVAMTIGANSYTIWTAIITGRNE